MTLAVAQVPFQLQLQSQLTPALTMNSLALPPEIISIIISDKGFSLQELIRLRAISKDWQTAIEKLLTKKDKLGICSTPSAGARSKTDLLVTGDNFNTRFTNRIVELFPSVTDLSVEITTEGCYNLLMELLNSYHANLKSLALTGFLEEKGEKKSSKWKIQPKEPFKVTTRLVTALRNMPNLTSLQLSTFQLNTFLSDSRMTDILAKLERFAFDGNQSSTSKADKILIALGNRCIHLQLPNDYLANLKGNLAIKTRLTELVITKGSSKVLDSVCEECLNLQSLHVHFSTVIVVLSVTMLQSLSRLTHLTDLQLLGIQYSTNLSASTSMAVKKLHLKLINRGALEVREFGQKLTAWFPQIEQLTIECYPECYHSLQPAIQAELDSKVNVQMKLTATKSIFN